MSLTLALLAATLVAPAVADARGNCCFELAVDNFTTYEVDYQEDGVGYDGEYFYSQTWNVRAIVSSRRSEENPVRVRDSYSLVHFVEQLGVTRCKDSSNPCFNREPLPCTGSDGFTNRQSSEYARGGGVSVSRDQLYALPPDDVYYSIDQLGCDGAHGHPGYGEKAEGVAGDRSVKLKPPGRDFLRTAGRADRCSYDFSSSLSQGLDHDHPPHTTDTSVNSSYKLSYFPREALRKQRERLGDLWEDSLGDQPDLPPSGGPFYKWGTDGTGSQTC